MSSGGKGRDEGEGRGVEAVPFYRHDLVAEDSAKIADVLATPFLTSGQVCQRVETQLCDFFEVGDAKLTNSWTNGALAVLLALEIGPGDEVIVPAMTFIASVNVIELLGATPVFVDVEPSSLLIDLAAVRSAVTPRTKAVIPVHLYGQMVDMAALRDVVGANIALVEDCAHAFESRLHGVRPGRHSDAAVFSFYATKNVTCGEGGAIVSDDAALMEVVRQTVLHGMSAGAARRFERGLYRHWDMARLGVKANLPDILAALLPDQIATVEDRREMRETIVARYRAEFESLEPLSMVGVVEGCVSGHHLFAVGVPADARDQVLYELNTAGIGTTVNYRAVHTMGYYADKYRLPADAFPNALSWGERTLSLPLYPKLKPVEQSRVVSMMASVLDRIGG